MLLLLYWFVVNCDVLLNAPIALWATRYQESLELHLSISSLKTLSLSFVMLGFIVQFILLSHETACDDCDRGRSHPDSRTASYLRIVLEAERIAGLY